MRKIPTDRSFFDLLTPVPESGCLLWFGHWGHKGYGRIHSVRLGGQQAHRFAWELANGPIPDGMQVLHKCDTPPCCNPAHLFLGSNLDNVADKVAKGRQGRAIGDRNRSAKLTEDDVRHVRSCSTGPFALARKYGVRPAAIREIRSGKTWKHVV